MAIDPVYPYGPLIDSRVRLVTWNVWGRFGPWEQRQSVIGGTLAGCSPDVVALQEAWSADDRDQAGALAAVRGLPYHRFAGDREENGGLSGTAVLSRWPIVRSELRPLGRPEVLT